MRDAGSAPARSPRVFRRRRDSERAGLLALPPSAGPNRGRVSKQAVWGTSKDMSELGGATVWDERGATELLLALATALDKGDVQTYAELLREAATEPGRSFVLIEMFVRLVLDLITDRAAETGTSRDEVLRTLALESAQRYYGADPP